MRKALLCECPLCGKRFTSCTIVHSVLGVPKTHPDDVLKCPQCNRNFKRADEKIVGPTVIPESKEDFKEMFEKARIS